MTGGIFECIDGILAIGAVGSQSGPDLQAFYGGETFNFIQHYDWIRTG